MIDIGNSLTGANIAGVSSVRERAENDFYATPFETTNAILDRVSFRGSILEPAAGQGHISKLLKERYPNNEIISTDLIKREDKFGCNIQSGIDFLTYDFGRKFDNVITNPPYSKAKEFIERALSISTQKVVMLAKIQLLEGEKRRSLFNKFPPRYIYVFSKRQNPMNNGSPVDENGKPWSTTICFAWFVWEHDFTGEPIIRWI